MISSRNNISIINFSSLSGGKVNLVGALRRSKLKVVFKSAWKNRKKKLSKNGNFYAKLVSSNSILFFGVPPNKITVDK